MKSVRLQKCIGFRRCSSSFNICFCVHLQHILVHCIFFHSFAQPSSLFRSLIGFGPNGKGCVNERRARKPSVRGDRQSECLFRYFILNVLTMRYYTRHHHLRVSVPTHLQTFITPFNAINFMNR